ncbi:MAG: 16S rRNA (guanine(527)-N(7))-methyltransferase RsmG [Deltaproteobacteria bacterium]|nr:16S rRNA (guanine(527)-N(7))-methyltransferase RsmG [Deltaproteobacteria bacterium]
MNLMSISSEAEFVDKHVKDVEKLIPYLKEVKTLVDLGSGAGVPGILIKIMKPKVDVTLVEATRKKVSFCEEVVRSLKLKEILPIWGRAEDEGLMRGLGAFGAVVSRATWDLKKYLMIADRYADGGGLCIAMKGSRWSEELREAGEFIEKSDLDLIETSEYKLEGGEKRAILIFKKALLQPPEKE